METHVSVDIGTSGGKVVAGMINDLIRTETVHRFDSRRVRDGNDVIWDVQHLVKETAIGLVRAETEYGSLSTVGIDATAEMFGLVADGDLVRQPVHTTSVHTADNIGPLTREEMFFKTGHARLPTGYDRLHQSEPDLVNDADWLGLLPALVGHGLGANPYGEVTYAISTGLGNTRTRDWARESLRKAELPTDLLPDLARIGSTVGTVSLNADLRLESSPEVVAVPGHDTSAAVASIPFEEEARAFLATGSWFITGFEMDEPVVTRAAFDAGAENVGGVDGTARFVQNAPGFSLLEHCREQWAADGQDVEYDTLFALAKSAQAFGPLIDPGADAILRAHYEGNVNQVIQEYCQRTGQEPPEGRGETVRCLLESYAASVGVLLDRLGSVVDHDPTTLHLVGGGAHNPLLCRMVAAATNTEVAVGPIEATTLGSLLVQFRSCGKIQSLDEGRSLLGRTIDLTYVEPQDHLRWRDALEQMRALKERDA